MLFRHFALALGAAVVCTLLCIPTAHATQILSQSLPDLGRSAELVIEGTVTAQRSLWNPSRTRILTSIDIEVERSHKGGSGGIVRVVQAGGEIDGMRMTVHGISQWKPGERVLLFLESAFAGQYRVAGFSQGKFQIEIDPATGQTLAVRPELGVGTTGGSDRTIRMPLATLLDRADLLTVREER